MKKFRPGLPLAMSKIRFIGLALMGVVLLLPLTAQSNPDYWSREWPNTDFTKTEIAFEEILSGGPPKDGIPAIDDPKFVPAGEVTHLKPTEPVIGLVVGDEAKAYPLQVLMWHEIVNDEIDGIPVSVTFCPLCNASLVFDRRIEHPEKGPMVLDFGTTGKLRKSDLVMYDRQTETWWQQFLGRGIVGELTGMDLKMIPVRIESFAKFIERKPDGLVLVPNNENFRRYGINPYEGYDSLYQPFLYNGDLPGAVPPLSRVVVAEGKAWALDFLRDSKRIETEDGLILEWEKGQNSALDARVIGEGVDIGNVTARRKNNGVYEDVLYTVDFAFAHYAFHPDTPIIHK